MLLRMASTRRAESCEMVNSTVLGIWYGRWVLVWADGPRALTWEVHCSLMVATGTGGWGAIVVWRNHRADVYHRGLRWRCRKSVSCARNKTWPGESKVRESRWWLRESRREHSNPLMHWRCLSVSFFAVADVQPTRERQDASAVNVTHQIDMIQRGKDHEERCQRADESEDLRA